jgi:hypothetical protein
MKHGKVGLLAPNFRMGLLKGKTGRVSRCAIGLFQRLAEAISRFQNRRRKGIWRSVVNVVRWMLLGIIIAGPNLQNLHSQDSRAARVADKKTPTTSVKLRPSARTSEPARAAAPSRGEIVLPDIYITLPADTIAAIKKRLEQAERDLQQLERERSRLKNTLEQFQRRSRNGASLPAPRATQLVGRPSV